MECQSGLAESIRRSYHHVGGEFAMKSPGQPRAKERGFTMMEIAIACSIAAVILVSIIIGSTSLQRIFAGSDAGLKATADQMRILDYIARDVRQALTATVSNSG